MTNTEQPNNSQVHFIYVPNTAKMSSWQCDSR